MRRVVITGLGTINGLGRSVESTFPRILAGENGVEQMVGLDTEGLGTTIVGCSVVIELGFLEGRAKLDGVEIHSLVSY